MAPRKTLILALALVALLHGRLAAQDKPLAFDRYHSPAQVGAALKNLASQHPQLAELQEIGKSAGDAAINVIRLAAASEGAPDPAKRQAVLVCANLEGNHLIGTEAALLLVERLLSGYAGGDTTITGLLKTRTVYVAPLLAPDAAQAYFAKPRQERTANAARIDDDLDMLTDEDGPDDLNGDGLITMMRVKDPEGEYICDPKDPRLMRKADPARGEAGVYKLHTEGLDNDGDEEYNEDAAGGVELNRNLPQQFEHLAAAGRWPVSQPETIALARFMFAHPTIALVLNFSTENTLLAPVASGSAGDSGGRGSESGERPRGPVTTIDPADKALFDAATKEFRDALKAAKIEYPEKKARGWGKGSLAAWSYFQYGVPVFSNDVWAVPEASKPAAGDKPTTASETQQSKTAEEATTSTATPHSDTDLIKYSDMVLKGKGFVPWAAFDHPTLGQVEIGGFIPYIKTLPPPSQIEKHARLAADFYIRAMQALPGLEIRETRVKALDGSLYLVTAYFTNPHRLPTATAQGRRAGTAWPVTVKLKMMDGQTLFSGRPIETISLLGPGETRKLEWTIRGPQGSVLEIGAETPRVGSAAARVTLQESRP